MGQYRDPNTGAIYNITDSPEQSEGDKAAGAGLVLVDSALAPVPLAPAPLEPTRTLDPAITKSGTLTEPVNRPILQGSLDTNIYSDYATLVDQAFLDRIGLSLLGFNSLTNDQLVTLMPQVSVADQQIFMQELSNRDARFEGGPKVNPQVLDADILAGAAGDGQGPYNPGAEFGPFQQYLNAIDVGVTGGGPVGAYQRSLYDPTQRLHGLEQGFAGVTGATPGPFGNYILENQTDPGALYGRAGEILRSLYAAGQTGREEFGATFGDQFGEPLENLRGEPVPTTQQQTLFDLALRPQFGARGARQFAGRLPIERQLFTERQSQGTNTATNFLDYLRDKYDLGRFFGAPEVPA